MSITHTITRTWTDGSETIEKSEAVSSGAAVNLDEAVADSSTDLELTFLLDQSAMKSFYMVSDQALLIETNSGSSATDSFTLTANQPIVWTTGGGTTNPITADITANIFATNSSGSTANLKIRVLQDPTP